MKLNKQYIELFHNCSDDIRSLSDDKTGSTIDRDIQAMMKSVLFDEKGKPISEEDKKNHQWNTDWLNCWQKGKVDKAKAEKMLAEHMPHVFDEAEKLLAVVKKNADNPKKLQAAMENYFENVMNNERDLLSFFQMSQFGLSIDNLKRKIPSVKEFIDNNPKFNKLDDLVGQARNVLNMYVNFTYGMDMTRQGVDFVYEKDKLASKKKALAPSYEGVLMMLSMTYQEDKEALDKATDYSYGKSKKKEEIKQEEIKEEIKEEKNENVNKEELKLSLDAAKKKEYFPVEAKGTSLRDFDDNEYFDKDVTEMNDEFSDYKLMSNDKARELSAKNPANDTSSKAYKTIYAGHVVYNKIDQEVNQTNYDDAVAPYILSPNAMAINQYIRAKEKNDEEVQIVYENRKMLVHQDIQEDINKWRGALDETISELDKATKVNELPEDTRLFRFVDGSFLEYALGMETNPLKAEKLDNPVGLDDSVSLDDIDDTLEVFGKYNDPGSADNLINEINSKSGTVVRDAGFMSTGYKADRGFLMNPICLTILADKGTKCFVTSHEDESEIILPRNTKYTIIGAKAHGNDGKLMPVSALKEAYNNGKLEGKPSALFRGIEIIVKVINEEKK